jgi:hypothetical protein
VGVCFTTQSIEISVFEDVRKEDIKRFICANVHSGEMA